MRIDYNEKHTISEVRSYTNIMPIKQYKNPMQNVKLKKTHYVAA